MITVLLKELVDVLAVENMKMREDLLCKKSLNDHSYYRMHSIPAYCAQFLVNRSVNELPTV